MTAEAPRSAALAAELDKLTPKQRLTYERMAAGWRAEWEIERLARAEVQDRIDRRPAPSIRRRLARTWSEIVDGLGIFALIAAIFVGASGLFGTCVAVVIALVRAGWRAGASL